MLSLIDVLVDGEFVQELYSVALAFRGFGEPEDYRCEKVSGNRGDRLACSGEPGNLDEV